MQEKLNELIQQQSRGALTDVAGIVKAVTDDLEYLRTGSVATLTDYPVRRQVEEIRSNPLVTVSDLKTGVWRKTYKCRDNVNLTPGPAVVRTIGAHATAGPYAMLVFDYMRLHAKPDADAALRRVARLIAGLFFNAEYAGILGHVISLRPACKTTRQSGPVGTPNPKAKKSTAPSPTPIVYTTLADDDRVQLVFALAKWIVVDGGAPGSVPRWPLEEGFKFLNTRLSVLESLDFAVVEVLIRNRPRPPPS